MPKTARQVVQVMERAGWVVVRQKNSHRQYGHPNRPGIVTVPMHRGDLKAKTLASIRKQTGLDELR